MTQDELKKAVGFAALKFVKPNTIVGVGTGSTAAHFIDALATIKHTIIGTVSSSEASTQKLKDYGIPVFDCNSVDSLDIYVDGADEINHQMQMIKGGGAALTREKIIAAISKQFICIADESKVVTTLDIHDFMIPNALEMEHKINNIPGVVTVGLFANRGANVALIGTANGVKEIK